MSKTFRLDQLATKLDTSKLRMSPNTFDPIEFVRTYVTTEKARHHVLSSMAWYIDITTLNVLRTLFFSVFQSMQAGGTIDHYNDFLADMNAAESRERNLVEQGFMETEGVGTLRRLFLLRQTWHDAALVNPRHQMPSLDTLLLNEKPQLPNALTKEKLRILAEDEAEGDAAVAEEIFNELVHRETMQAMDRLDASRARVPAMIGMAGFIEATSTEQEADFNDLPITTRKRLLQGTVSALGQATSRMTTDRSVNAIEFLAIRKELKAATAALNEVLMSDLYRDEDIPSQAAIEEKRLDKEIAKHDEGNLAEAVKAAAKVRKAKGKAIEATV